MTGGLEINLVSFEKMKAKERDVLIYQNVLDTKKTLTDYKFHRKINYTWLGALTTGVLFIGKIVFDLK